MEIVCYTINKAKQVKNRKRKKRNGYVSVIPKKISRHNRDDTCDTFSDWRIKHFSIW